MNLGRFRPHWLCVPWGSTGVKKVPTSTCIHPFLRFSRKYQSPNACHSSSKPAPCRATYGACNTYTSQFNNTQTTIIRNAQTHARTHTSPNPAQNGPSHRIPAIPNKPLREIQIVSVQHGSGVRRWSLHHTRPSRDPRKWSRDQSRRWSSVAGEGLLFLAVHMPFYSRFWLK